MLVGLDDCLNGLICWVCVLWFWLTWLVGFCKLWVCLCLLFGWVCLFVLCYVLGVGYDLRGVECYNSVVVLVSLFGFAYLGCGYFDLLFGLVIILLLV